MKYVFGVVTLLCVGAAYGSDSDRRIIPVWEDFVYNVPRSDCGKFLREFYNGDIPKAVSIAESFQLEDEHTKKCRDLMNAVSRYCSVPLNVRQNIARINGTDSFRYFSPPLDRKWVAEFLEQCAMKIGNELTEEEKAKDTGASERYYMLYDIAVYLSPHGDPMRERLPERPYGKFLLMDRGQYMPLYKGYPPCEF
jgi:hypothetical protein